MIRSLRRGVLPSDLPRSPWHFSPTGPALTGGAFLYDCAATLPDRIEAAGRSPPSPAPHPVLAGLFLRATHRYIGAMPPCRPLPRRPTLGQLRRLHPWWWVNCAAPGCGRHKPVALAPLVIRWGADASSDVLRRSARCSKCGCLGVTLTAPSWAGSQVGFAPFPIEWPRPI